jgi:hypothetical protein
VQKSGIPQLTASPILGPGPTFNFTFSASSPDGFPPPTGMTILINSSVDGRHACWLHFDGQLTLASDDGAAWAVASGSQVQNSQCQISNVVDVSSGSSLGVSVTVAFYSPFNTAGKHIYMTAVNDQGETGYQFIESWTN